MAPTTLQDVAVELQRQLQTKRDIVADTRCASFGRFLLDSQGDFQIDLPDGVESFGMTRHAHQQLATHLDIPFKLYERLGTDKLADLGQNLVNGLLAREPSKRFIRTLDGNVRAFMSNGYRPRDNWDLLEHILPVINEFPNVEIAKAQLTESRLYLKVTVPGIGVQVTTAVGDVIQGGVIISNSEIGSGSLYAYPWTLRLACLNGMTHEDFGQRRIHVGKRIDAGEEAFEWYSDETKKLDDAAFFAKVADTVRGCLNERVFEAIAAQMRELAEIELPSVPDAVEVVAKDFNQDERDSILKHIISGGDPSAWGLVNGITAMARDLFDADRAAEVEIFAGRVTADPAKYGLKAAAA